MLLIGRGVVVGVAGRLATDEDGARRFVVADFGPDLVEAPWGTEGILPGGRFLFAKGKRVAGERFTEVVVGKNFLA